MGISSAGIGSGLDVNSIVTSLMGIEQKPLTAVTKQKTDYQAQISAYGTLKSSLSTFQTAVSGLSSASKFNAQAVSSGNASAFTATSDGSATIGDYAVTVGQLAKPQKLATAGFTNVTDTVDAGMLVISFGKYDTSTVPYGFTSNTAKTPINITIDSSNYTLAGVRDAINATNSSVSATIVNNGTTNQLVITSKDTGEVNSLKISGIPQLAYDPSTAAVNTTTQIQAAKNAEFNVDGIPVVKASNMISDVIGGVTLNLLATSAGVSANLGVTSNQEAVKTSVAAFVSAYNSLDTTLRNLTKYDPTGKASGVLLGDGTARTLIGQIKSVMTKAISSSGSFSSLGQIGVSFQTSGQLALDSTKLTAAMTSNFGDIAKLFANSAKATDGQVSFSASSSKTQAGTYAVNVSSTSPLSGTINGATATTIGTRLVGAVGDASEGLDINVTGLATGSRGTINFSLGYATQLNTVMTNLLSATGILSSRTDGINSSITRLDKQAESITLRLTAIEKRYRDQFTRLDTLMASMTTTSNFLTQQIASINSNK